MLNKFFKKCPYFWKNKKVNNDEKKEEKEYAFIKAILARTFIIFTNSNTTL